MGADPFFMGERQPQLAFCRQSVAAMSQPALNKIAANSPSRAHPSELEQNIAGALYELEQNIPDLKSALRPLQFASARELEVGHNKLLDDGQVVIPGDVTPGGRAK